MGSVVFSVYQARLGLAIIPLPLLPECWCYRFALLDPAGEGLLGRRLEEEEEVAFDFFIFVSKPTVHSPVRRERALKHHA